jgi:hypothetical protein
VNLLLDTHAFLWFCQDDPSLSAAAKAVVADPGRHTSARVFGGCAPVDSLPFAVRDHNDLLH